MALNTLYEINTHVWVREQDWFSVQAPELADIPEVQLQQWQEAGLEAIWFLGVWEKGADTRRIAWNHPDLKTSFQQLLPDLQEKDVLGSPFSIARYQLSPDLGKPDSLARLREKMARNGLKLILDFVPNHVAIDHPWVQEHPEYFVAGTPQLLEQKPGDFFRVPGQEHLVLAHGRDPYFSGWTDTAQMNLFSRDLREALLQSLQQVAEVCDGVRCDMAMLMTNSVFKKTWGDLSFMDFPEGDPPEFWEWAIGAVQEKHPDFLFMAEVYWGMGPQLREMGFDCIYDKDLYDLARAGDGAGIRGYLFGTREMENQMVRFVENHDEDRAAEAFGHRHQAAAALIGALPGVKLFHEGQFQNRVFHVPVQLARRPQEMADGAMEAFYRLLLDFMSEKVMKEGDYVPLYVSEAWEGNPTARQIVTIWRSSGENHRLVAVNLGNSQAQAHTEIPADVLTQTGCIFRDRVHEKEYLRCSLHLEAHGLYLDLPPGGVHLFEVEPTEQKTDTEEMDCPEVD